jgi:lysine 6-dehydrogenase
MTHAIVLGAGMVGSAMAMDLKKSGLDVTVVDARKDALERVAARFGVRTLQADLSDPAEVKRAVREADVVLGALSSVLGLQTLRAVIEAKKRYVDISFMADDATALDGLAKEHGVCAVVDCGVAPGMSNMLAGHAAATLAPCERIDIFVGGLPVVRTWPYEYKAGFSPHDVIEEYVRPSRVVEHGKIVVKEALSEPELLEFEGVGTLEAFNTDGLRSLTKTLAVPNMREKTMRYPGHIALMRVLRETGFFSQQPIEVKGQKLRPLDVTAALMFPKWTFEDGEADITIMRVTAWGGGREVSWDLMDRYDPETGFRSMSRTTAFPATIMAQMILDRRFTDAGVHPPEIPGQRPGILDDMMKQLEKRGVHYRKRGG